jgi:DNA-binding CsgD family transcriptional regulator
MSIFSNGDYMALKNPHEKQGPKFSKTEREEVLVKVASLDRRGFTEWEIAQQVHVSAPMVHNYLRTLRERHLESQKEFSQTKLMILEAQYQEIIREAWNQWERSKEDSEEAEQTWEKPWRPDDPKTGKPMGRAGDYDKLILTRETKTSKGRLGCPVYLTVITDCLDRLAKLHGLYQEKPLQVQATVASFNWDQLAGMIPQDGKVPDRLEQALEAGVGMALAPRQEVEDVPVSSSAERDDELGDG